MRSSVVPWTVPVRMIRTTITNHRGHTPLCLSKPGLSLQIRTYKSTLRPLNPHHHHRTFSAPRHPLSSTSTKFSTRSMSEFYNLKTELPNGSTYSFEELKGKVVLIVNVASKWYVPSFFLIMCIVLLTSVQRVYSSVQGYVQSFADVT